MSEALVLLFARDQSGRPAGTIGWACTSIGVDDARAEASNAETPVNDAGRVRSRIVRWLPKLRSKSWQAGNGHLNSTAKCSNPQGGPPAPPA